MPFRDIFSKLEDYVRDRGTHAVWQGPNFNVLVSKRLVEKVLRNLPPDSANREPFKAHYAKFFDPKARHAENLDRDLHGKVLLELLETRDVNARSTFHLLMDEVGLDIGFHVYGLFRGYRNLELRLAEKPAEEGTATQTPLIDAVRLIHQIGDPPVFTQVPDEPVERRFRCMLRDCAKPITSVSIYQLRNHLHKHHQYSWDEINSISKENNNEALWKRFGPFSKQELEDSGYEMRNFKSRQSGFPTKAQDPQQEGTGEDETNHPFEEEQAESPDLRQSSRIQRRNRPQVVRGRREGLRILSRTRHKISRPTHFKPRRIRLHSRIHQNFLLPETEISEATTKTNKKLSMSSLDTSHQAASNLKLDLRTVPTRTRRRTCHRLRIKSMTKNPRPRVSVDQAARRATNNETHQECLRMPPPEGRHYTSAQGR